MRVENRPDNPASRLDAERERYRRHFGDWQEESLIIPDGFEYEPGDLRSATLYALEQLGDLGGVRMLEIGAGSGQDSVVFARRGARVVVTDLSPEAVQLAKQRFRANGVTVEQTAAMSAEAIAFPSESFDRVYGRGILHHINLEAAAPEIGRILGPEGRAVFVEPLSENPLLEVAREHLPYRHKTRPKGHQGLRYASLRAARRHFSKTSVREFYLTSMLNRVFGFDVSLRRLERLDDWLLKRVPSFRRLCRYVVVTFEK
jgi:SAM-dependent methyltransferase